MLAVGLGETLWDVFGGTRCMGGAPANFAYHAAAQGCDAVAISALGTDAAGDALAAAFAELGVHLFAPRVAYPTGEVTITIDGQGVPDYEFRPDCAWDHLEASAGMLEIARRTQLVCFGTLAQRNTASREAIAAFLEAMPQGEDKWRVLDMNLRGHFYTDAILRESLRVADALKINDIELETIARREALCGLPQLEQARILLQRYDQRLLIITCGALGSHVLTAAGECRYEAAPSVTVADSVGAGDAFTAAFFARLLRGASIAEAQQAATQLAAYVCSQPGAMPPPPDSV